MTVKGGSRPACASCRFQRRRCSSSCPLASFFPATETKSFQNVHRLYGVGNTMKILNQLKDDGQKEEAMKSIKYESHIRQIHKVHGCYGLISHLHHKVMESMRELQYVRVLIDSCKKNNDEGRGGSSDWISGMINGGSDLGFYNEGSSDHVGGYDWFDDEMKGNQSQFDGFQQLQVLNKLKEARRYGEAYDLK
ncbi:hypothetical protein L1987_65872 [Smallanthus sonchifolius]|uniref:Uncharacterized protein n=1 Tax=Smallanthus sonchifolius TaxID=185202 RepID=A0ACB9BVQ8_9ASTR|nr:hypothetical protein L1987_65872 [Smallanthus sonchifolius]